MDEDCFFICVYLDEKGMPKGHIVSPKDEFAEKSPTKKTKSSVAQDDGSSDFSDIMDKFQRSMFAYIDLLPIIAAAAPSVTWMMRFQNFLPMLDGDCIEKRTENERVIFRLKSKYYQKYREFDDAAEAINLVGRQIPKMLIIGVVSSYEYYASRIIREIFKMNSGMLEGSEKNVSVRDVFNVGSIEEFKNSILDKEIEDVMRRSFAEQIKWFEVALGIKKPISTEYKQWSPLVEVFERRNLFAHANGVVGKRYIERINVLDLEMKKPDLGDELYANEKYFKESLENVTEFGFKLIQLVWRRLRSEEIVSADKSASKFAFELIEKGEYVLAAKIYQFIEESSKKIEPHQGMMNIINLANCYALIGDVTLRDSVLAKFDWSTSADKFNISASAIRGDVGNVIHLMNRLSRDADWDESFYESWPVFFHVRESSEFIASFEDLYKRKFMPQPKTKSAASAISAIVAESSKKVEFDGSEEVKKSKAGLH